MFYKIYHNLVAIPLPQYIQAPIRFTRHMHPLYLQKVQTGSLYHYYSFLPHSITLWGKLSADIATLPDLAKRAVSNVRY
ncbi:hypothetical protein DPMN_186426 [Dreissena polymorpha]|uniref:Uncharacterized protein n=1 Tax=Dreissena polymorpha TaxID=45954 RepID=A0A9D4DQE1_DREPO|nr:hypothetical protein DPMN_186426 [Dreissena polymorpha]